jgi:murein DD-endopeptidase MepM/ murein hydrolase activator NlpD
MGRGAPQPPAGNYGDWTKPSRDQEERRRPAREPETSLIPERTVSGRGASHPDSRELELERPERAPSSDPSMTSTRVVGGRAALRAQRQAADAERRKAVARQENRSERTATSGRGRRLAVALVAVAVVALGVLGVYSFTSPKTKQAAHTAATSHSAAPTDAAAPAAQSLPPLDTGTQSVASAPAAAPVKVPITVLNETSVTGLAAKLSSTFGGGGWPTTGVGAYKGNDVAASTVYFTQGDENQRQAAVALVTQFPQLSGPVPRFFDVPGNPNPGLVVVAAGDWKP